jgi:hypothetical protein
MIDLTKTQRGFDLGKFEDLYGEECSIRKSSLATEDAIWLGVDKPKLIVFENETMGKYIETRLPKTWSVNCHMHLSRDLVRQLLPILQKFVETGELE